MLRTVKIMLVGAVALWGLLGALGNVTDWGGTMGAVGAATSMVTFEGGADSWKATSNPGVIWAGALFIMLSKVVAGILCAIAMAHMVGARTSDAASFQAAKTYALAGSGIIMFMLFGGFIIVADGWFELWRSEAMRGPVLDSAFRYGAMIMLIALFVGAKDD